MAINLKLTTSELTNYRSENLLRYYEDIKKKDILSEEDEKALFKLYQTGNNVEKDYARDKIVISNQRFVIAVAKRYATESNLLDLIQECNIGLIQAIDEFNVDNGTRFLSLAVWYMRRAINEYYTSKDKMIRPTNVTLTYHAQKEAKIKFFNTEHRLPTEEELMEILKEEYNVNIKNKNDLFEVHVESIENDSQNGDFEESDGIGYEFNKRYASSNEYLETEKNEYNSELLNTLFSKLSERDAKVLKMHFGIGYPRAYELSEIASELDMTTERIRQIKINSINKLKAEGVACLAHV